MKITITMEFDTMEEALEALQATPARALLEESVDVLGLSVRARNILRFRFEDVETVGDLLKLTRRDMRLAPGCGETTVREIAGKLRLKGLTW